MQLLDLPVDVGKIELLPVGDNILSIVKAWGKKTKVTVREFCDVACKLGVTRIGHILCDAAEAAQSRSLQKS